MSKDKKKRRKPDPEPAERMTLPASSKRAGAVAIVCLLVAIVAAVLAKRNPGRLPPGETNVAGGPALTEGVAPPVAVPIRAPQPGTNPPPKLPEMPINQAVMVTVELEFGPKLPSIAEALKEVERRHQPDVGTNRTFAILDAYGGPTSDGKKLHLSMHVSSERPGIGTLVFRRTGEVLWQCRIVLGTNTGTFTGKDLSIWLGDDAGKASVVDGSGHPASLLDARLRDTGMLVRDFWPDDAEREVTFIYSACGCPVKVLARRTGERTVRTKDMPVIFPDDPAVVQVISRLMRW